jgi:serine/threonine protein kinase
MLATGTPFSHFRIGEPVADQDGPDIVYVAEDLNDGGRVALKVYESLAPGDHENFEYLAPLRLALDHPNIVRALDIGIADGLPFMATALVSAPTLGEVAGRNPLDSVRVLPIITALADALDAAGDAGLVHRDLRAGSVLLADGDRPLLTDLGFGDRVRADGAAAPEELAGEPATFRSNVYSLAAIFAAIVAEPELPRPVERVLGAAMASQPGDRQASCGALAGDLAQAFEQIDGPAPVPAAPIPAPLPVARLSAPVAGAPKPTLGARARNLRLPRLGAPQPLRGRNLRLPRLAVPQPLRGRVRSVPKATAIAVVAALLAASAGFGVGRIGSSDGERVVGPPPASAQARHLTDAVASLNAVRVRERDRLASSKAPKARATAAAEIATAYRAAAESLSDRRSNSELSKQLGRAADAYGDLAGAALRESRSGWNEASRAVLRAERRVDRELRLTQA